MADIHKKNSDDKGPERKRNPFVLILIAVFTIGVIWFIIWFFYLRFIDSTDDAYVHGNQIVINAKVNGFVTSVHTQDTYYVKQGEVLVKLDTVDYQTALDLASSELAKTLRDVSDLFQAVNEAASQFKEQEAIVKNHEVEFLDRKNVVASGAVSKEDFIAAEFKLKASMALLSVQKTRLVRAFNRVQNTTIKTHPLVEGARQHVIDAWVNLKRCTIVSPADGIVAMRSVQVGQNVASNTPLLSIIPLDDIWVEANFKETDLAKIQVGQTVEMKSDMYGSDHIFTGQVIGIGGGTGAVFSPLPPQNATGNWIKILQRVPVRISIDSEQLQRFPLRIGLSMHVKIQLKDEWDRQFHQPVTRKILYQTDAYNKELQGVQKHIEDIFDKNIAQGIEKHENLQPLTK